MIAVRNAIAPICKTSGTAEDSATRFQGGDVGIAAIVGACSDDQAVAVIRRMVTRLSVLCTGACVVRIAVLGICGLRRHGSWFDITSANRARARSRAAKSEIIFDPHN